MDDDRLRRLAVLVLLCGVFLVTSWIEDISYTMHETRTGNGKVCVCGGRGLSIMIFCQFVYIVSLCLSASHTHTHTHTLGTCS